MVARPFLPAVTAMLLSFMMDQGPAAALEAFPSARGFGSHAMGGRGGDVHLITTLDDAGPGSLRACIEASGPRTCIFRVGGTIELASSLQIRHPFITIAGQTAPGDGIMLKNGPGNPHTPIVVMDTHDVIIRYIRSRPGPSDLGSLNLDAMEIIQGSHDVIIDHVSLSWSVDEVFSIFSEHGKDPYDITLQWSLLAEGLDRSLHKKDRKHSKGLLLTSGKTGGGPYAFSIHHNLIAHNRDRMPDLNLNGLVDFTNNVLYNGKSEFGEFWTGFGNVDVNYVGNYVRNGPSTEESAYEIDLKPVDPQYSFRLFLEGNIGPRRPTDDLHESIILKKEDRRFVVDRPHTAPDVGATSAKTAYLEVIKHAGAVLPERDEVDRRIVQSVQDREGRIIDHPREVGGWPVLKNGPAPDDRDQDGMPDDFERRHGLDPDDPEDRNGDRNGDGYTNLEDYLNELAGDFVPE